MLSSIKCRLLEPIDDDDPMLNVELRSGKIRGINLAEGHRAWLGIPYAKPPIGKTLNIIKDKTNA